MVLGKERAVTHLNSWNRCLVREDGMLSPASLYLLTVVACTRSWSQMAALWRSIHRRTGETTVRISTATPQIRNWVRKPVSVILAVCMCVCLYISSLVLRCFISVTPFFFFTIPIGSTTHRASVCLGQFGYPSVSLKLPAGAWCLEFHKVPKGTQEFLILGCTGKLSDRLCS